MLSLTDTARNRASDRERRNFRECASRARLAATRATDSKPGAIRRAGVRNAKIPHPTCDDYSPAFSELASPASVVSVALSTPAGSAAGAASFNPLAR